MGKGLITTRGSIAEYFGTGPYLKALWTLDGHYQDFSGNNHHGTPVTGVFRQGILPDGQSAIMNGTNGYINVPHHADFNFSTNVDYAVLCWINRTAAQPGVSPLLIDHRSAGGTGWIFWIKNDTAQFNATIGNQEILGATGIGVFRKPLFLAFVNVRTLNQVSFIANDVVTNVVGASATDVNDSAQLTIGSRSFTQPANTLNGQIDEIAIFSGKIPTAMDMVAYYQWAVAKEQDEILFMR